MGPRKRWGTEFLHTDEELTGWQVAVQIEFYKFYKYFNSASKLSFYVYNNR